MLWYGRKRQPDRHEATVAKPRVQTVSGCQMLSFALRLWLPSNEPTVVVTQPFVMYWRVAWPGSEIRNAQSTARAQAFQRYMQATSACDMSGPSVLRCPVLLKVVDSVFDGAALENQPHLNLYSY